MPRIVDHDQRRIELAEAVWSLIRQKGIEGVTIRQITAQTGWSSGAIRHYLPDRDAILGFAAQHVSERVQTRIRAIPRTGHFKHDFVSFTYLMLPLDDETRAWMEVWLSFVGLSATDPQFNDTQGILYSALHKFLKQCFTDLARMGWLPHYTPQAATLELHALLDGLSIHLLLNQITPEQARTTLTSALERMLPEPVSVAESSG